jgi:mono/diheme cytochrome c family protein
MKSLYSKIWGVLLGAALTWPAPAIAMPTLVEKGAYIFNAAGCAGCHTSVKPKGAPLAGGRQLKTPFGVFITPNISPDPKTGIGEWTEADFIRAMREGRSPDGAYYFPAFPYASYTGMTDDDLTALWAYLQSRPAQSRANQAHQISFPFNQRRLLFFWRFLYFEKSSYVSDPEKSAAWNRGAYLVRAVGHCGECHTPRTMMGGMRLEREFAGSLTGPEGKRVPNITPHKPKGIGGWSPNDIVTFLSDGSLPDGDYVGGAMTEVVENSTSRMTEDDLQAIAIFLLSTPKHVGP